MLKIKDLNFGYNDAENYRRRENKDFFNKIFLVGDVVDRILNEGTYFLMGEKGTGKTAYAVYLSNNNIKQTRSDIKFIRETDYKRFVQMKVNRHLMLSDYNLIWKVIILLMISKEIKTCINNSNPLTRFFKYKQLDAAIDDYYSNAFTPEIMNAIEFIENSEASLKLVNQHLGATVGSNTTIKEGKNKFQMELYHLEKRFQDAIESITLNDSFILFIDGVDIKPTDVKHDDYLECIKGLTHAIWDINNDFLANIKRRNGKKIKVVLLIRPDIFADMGLQNQNNKIKDNSVLLDWKTTYKIYKHSNIFKMVSRLLSKQQTEHLNADESWEYYFPYKIWNHTKKNMSDSSFIGILRHSFHRPRDIISMLDFMQKYVAHIDENRCTFVEEDFNNSLQEYSHYLLGEIKDHLTFYYSNDEYELFLKFFQYLNGRMRFTYNEYISAYANFYRYIKSNVIFPPSFFESSDIFLQFLYELNILCYIDESEDEDFIHWCFRERSYANISPKVKTESIYQIHHGLAKSLNVGKKRHRY